MDTNIIKNKNLIIFILTMLIAGIIAASYMHLWGNDLNVPVSGYRSDSVGMLLETSNYLRGGDIYTTKIYRAPNIGNYIDKISDYMLIIPINAFLAKIFGSVEAGINVHAVIACMLLAGSMFFISQKLRIGIFQASIISVLYSCIPFFALDSNTLLIAYCICFYIPLFCYCTIFLMTDDNDGMQLIAAFKNKKTFYLFYVVTMFLVGIYSAYYAFFAIFILVLVCVYAFLANHSVQKVMLCILGLISIGFGIAIYIVPNILYKIGLHFIWEKKLYYPLCLIVGFIIYAGSYWFSKKIYPKLKFETLYWAGIVLLIFAGIAYIILKNYTNFLGEFDGRSLASVEGGSYKFAHIFLPTYANFIDKINEIIPYFADIEQDEYFMLGIFAGIGFVYSVTKIIRLKRNESIYDRIVEICGICNVYIVLLGVKSGLSSIIAAFITTGIRNFNRICVYLAVFSFISFAILLEKTIQKISKLENLNKKRSLYGILFIGIIAGVITSIPKDCLYGNNYELASYEQRKTEHDEWVDYIGKIEQKISDGSMILELPQTVSDDMVAELMTKGRLYELSIPAIVSKDSLWSYAGHISTTVSLEENADKYLEEVKNEGFSGIYVDTLLLKDGNKDVILEILKEKLGDPIICKENRRYFFYIENAMESKNK